MPNALIIYSTTDGHALKVAKYIKENVETTACLVELINIDDTPRLQNVNLNDYDKILIGASIRYGKHNKQVYDFIDKYKTTLESLPTAFFTINAVARKEDKNTPDTNPYIIKFLTQVNWQPVLKGVFAGRIIYHKYGFFDRHMIRFIMWITKGPTDLKGTFEFTDWNKVDDFIEDFKKL